MLVKEVVRYGGEMAELEKEVSPMTAYFEERHQAYHCSLEMK